MLAELDRALHAGVVPQATRWGILVVSDGGVRALLDVMFIVNELDGMRGKWFRLMP